MSTKYVCNRCNKEFTVKCNFLGHLNRKNPCIKKDKNGKVNTTCTMCNHTFSRFTNLSKHQRVSKCGKQPNTLSEKVAQLEKKNDALQKIVLESLHESKEKPQKKDSDEITELKKAHEEELKMKDLKIQILQDMFIKKQKQATYEKSSNVIYVLTTDAHKKDRTYIIGKAKNLQKRLSTYNKTLEHEVVYYKECNSEETMGIVETMVLTKLKQYKEKANRDRFILPHDKDISFFTQIISNSIHFFSS